MTKFCKDCDHFVQNLHDPEMSKCKAVLKKSLEWLVTGNGSDGESVYCMTARDSVGDCGPDAKLWERKISGNAPAR